MRKKWRKRAGAFCLAAAVTVSCMPASVTALAEESGGAPVSASRVRAMIAEGAPGLEALLPEVTLDYLKSPRGEEAAARLRRAAQ